MNDLDTRLRGLTDLSPPSRAPLGADELHRRATRDQRRAFALRAVPAALVVVVLLAGAVALRSRDAGSEITVTTPDPPTTTSAGLSERDREMVGFLVTAAELRHQLERESVLSAAYGGSSWTSAEAELAAQRAATDAAVSRYREVLDSVRPGEESAQVAEAIIQADSRLLRLDVIRRSVDDAPNEIYDDLVGYENTILTLGDVPVQYLQGVELPALFRGVLTASNYGEVADLEAATASRLTVAVEVGYFPFAMDFFGSGPSMTGSGVIGCGGDPSAAGDMCKAYAETLEMKVKADQAELTFQDFADPTQKQLARTAAAGSRYDEIERAAFEDGVGQNDLRGVGPSSVAIDPLDWRVAALGHIDRMADVERQLYETIGTGGSTPDPASPDAGSAPGTLPAPSGRPDATAAPGGDGGAPTTSPAVPEPAVGSGSDDEDGEPRASSAAGTMPPNEREVVLEPNGSETP